MNETNLSLSETELMSMYKADFLPDTIGHLVDWCVMRNQFAALTPELYDDEPHKILTFENMSIDHIVAAKELKEQYIEIGFSDDEDDDIAIVEDIDLFLDKLLHW